MKNFKKLQIVALAFLLGAMLISCSDDPEKTDPYKVTQGELDAVSAFIKSFEGGQFAHGGPDGVTSDSTIREIFASISDLNKTIPVGTIITKNTYKRDAEGNKTDQLYVSFALVKRENGYFPDGGDWEYIKMPFDETVDYDMHPFGMLPEEGASTRGQLGSCAGCHSAASGGDYLYVND